jgi:hypothetical protein
VAFDTPSKFPVFAATPGKDIRRHSLLYSPSFAKIKGGALGRTPADIIKRATGGTAPLRTSPLPELDTSETLGHVSTPIPNRNARGPSASPIRIDEENGSFQSEDGSPKGARGEEDCHEPRPRITGDRLSFSRADGECSYATADRGTSPMMIARDVATPTLRGSAKEVRLHTDIMTKEVERVVEKIVTVEVPGPERIVEVERVVIKEVRPQCLGVRALRRACLWARMACTEIGCLVPFSVML